MTRPSGRKPRNVEGAVRSRAETLRAPTQPHSSRVAPMDNRQITGKPEMAVEEQNPVRRMPQSNSRAVGENNTNPQVGCTHWPVKGTQHRIRGTAVTSGVHNITDWHRPPSNGTSNARHMAWQGVRQPNADTVTADYKQKIEGKNTDDTTCQTHGPSTTLTDAPQQPPHRLCVSSSVDRPWPTANLFTSHCTEENTQLSRREMPDPAKMVHQMMTSGAQNPR